MDIYESARDGDIEDVKIQIETGLTEINEADSGILFPKKKKTILINKKIYIKQFAKTETLFFIMQYKEHPQIWLII